MKTNITTNSSKRMNLTTDDTLTLAFPRMEESTPATLRAIVCEKSLKRIVVTSKDSNEISKVEKALALKLQPKSKMKTNITTNSSKRMNLTTDWKVSNIDKAQYLGTIEFKDNKNEYHSFEVLATSLKTEPNKLVFGGACNTGFLESGYILRESCESIDETLAEMLADLEVYYNDGKQFVSRIVCNERM